MTLAARLWREASLATELEGFLARVGVSLLDEVDADALLVRSLNLDQRHLMTVATVRRGRSE